MKKKYIRIYENKAAEHQRGNQAALVYFVALSPSLERFFWVGQILSNEDEVSYLTTLHRAHGDI